MSDGREKAVRVRSLSKIRKRREAREALDTYHLGTALSGTSGALTVAIGLMGGGESRGDGGQGGNSGQDGLELHFERFDWGS